MKIALAQLQSFPGQIKQNLQRHEVLIKEAVQHQADLIVFPELSISGYEPTLAKELATSIDDPNFKSLKTLSTAHDLIIAAGFPLLHEERIYIAMMILSPEKAPQVYCKQNLHEDEQAFFVEGQRSILIQKNEYLIAPAICYESLLPEHAAAAAEKGANIYLAAVAKAEKGIKKANSHYPEVARKYQMPVLMVNNIGPADDFVGVGHSGVWDETGKLVYQLKQQEGLLIVDLKSMQTAFVDA